MSTVNTSRAVRALLLACIALPLAGAYAGGQGMGSHGKHASNHCGDGEAGMRHMGGKHRGGMQRMEHHVEGRIAFLKAELAISEEQEGAWQTLENVLRETMEQRAEQRGERSHMRSKRHDMSAPDRLAAHISAMESRIEKMRAMEGAVSDLYAVLSPEQQQAADKLLSRTGRHHMRMR